MKNILNKHQPFLAILVFAIPLIFSIIFYFLRINSLIILLLMGIIHLVSVVPLEFILSQRNRWESKKSESKSNVSHFIHPRLAKHFSLAIIYPYSIMVLLFLLRYINIGRINNFQFRFEFILFLIILLIIIIVNYSFFLQGFSYFVSLKEYLWKKTASFCFPFYLYLLQKQWFFILMGKIHKTHFYVSRLINLKSEIYWKFNYTQDFSFLRKLISYVHNNPIIYSYILGIIFVFELLIFKQIYYFYYISFSYIILLYLGKGFVILGNRSHYLETCFSDYLYCNIRNPRYVKKFRAYITNPPLFYNFHQLYSPEQIADLKLRTIHIKSTSNLMYSNRMNKLFDRVNTKHYGTTMRIKSFYLYINREKF